VVGTSNPAEPHRTKIAAMIFEIGEAETAVPSQKNFRIWHQADMRLLMSDVRFGGEAAIGWRLPNMLKDP
jgi:hypothetical protein